MADATIESSIEYEIFWYEKGSIGKDVKYVLSLLNSTYHIIGNIISCNFLPTNDLSSSEQNESNDDDSEQDDEDSDDFDIPNSKLINSMCQPCTQLNPLS